MRNALAMICVESVYERRHIGKNSSSRRWARNAAARYGDKSNARSRHSDALDREAAAASGWVGELLELSLQSLPMLRPC